MAKKKSANEIVATPEILPALPEIVITFPGEVTINATSDLDAIKTYLIQRWGVMKALQRRTALEFFLIGRAVHLGQLKFKAVRQFTRWMNEALPFSTQRGYDAMAFFRAVAGDDINYDPSDILAGWTISKAQEVYGLVEPKKIADKPATPVKPDSTQGDTSTQVKPDATPDSTQGDASTPIKPDSTPDSTSMPGSTSTSEKELREKVVSDLDNLYGQSSEPFSLDLPLTVFNLVGMLASQEEANESEVIARAVREYWLRHGDPTQSNVKPVGRHDDNLVYTQVTG